MKKLKVTQIGVGNFGKYRRNRMRETGLFELVAAYDIAPAALDACVQEEACKAVRSYDELLAVPGIEAVIIATGAKFHAEQIIKAAEKGLHVFVEKPLCSTPQEMRSILAIAKKTGVVIGVGHADHSRQAVSRTIKRLIDQNEFGKVATFEKTICHTGGLLIKPGDWRGDPEKNPGGMLFQCGVHGIHELSYYFGRIDKVACMLRYDVHTTATADVALCQLHFESGLIGTLNAYHVSPYRHTLSIFGTTSNLYRFDYYFDEGAKLYRQFTLLDGKLEPHIPLAITEPDDLCGNLKSFYAAVTRGAPCYPSVTDGARAVAAVFAAEEAARTGKVTAVPAL